MTGADGDDDPAMVAALKASLETAGGGPSSPVRVPPNRAVEVVDDDEGQDQEPSSKAKVAANGGKAAGRAMKVAEVFAEPLNMAKYQCSHGKLDPNKTPYLKVSNHGRRGRSLTAIQYKSMAQTGGETSSLLPLSLTALMACKGGAQGSV